MTIDHLNRIVLVCAIFGSASCSSSEAAEPDGPSPPEQGGSGPVGDAYHALSNGDVQRLPELLEALDAASAADPTDGRVAFFSGTVRLWKLAEVSQGLDVAAMAPFALPMIDHLKRAHELLPEDERVPSFLGLAQVRVGLTLRNDAFVRDGLASLDAGILRMPAYGYFLRASANDVTPAGSERYAGVVDDLLTMAGECGYETDDRGAYVYPPGPLEGGRRVCNNESIVPHVWEGIFILFGDVALKAGWEPARARVLYESAKSSPSYDEWPFASDLEARINGAGERAALYADTDPANDPPVWTDAGHVCVGCHQSRP